MKHYLIEAANHKLKILTSYFRDFCIGNIVQQQSLPAFPDIEWELHGETDYRNRNRLMARFFFLLGCLILSVAIGVYLWQSATGG